MQKYFIGCRQKGSGVMESYIVKKLTDKYIISKEEALAFFKDLENRRKLEHLVWHIDKCPCYAALKSFYYGGTYEL